MNMQQVYLWPSLYTSLLFSANQKTGLPHGAFGSWHEIVVTSTLRVGGAQGNGKELPHSGEPELD